MGSQFVDFNADGHLDYLSATFDGSPHISYGSADGFAEPVRLKDANGERIIITYLWNYDSRKHETVHRAMPDGMEVQERCISALAFDWDGDGDHDLLLGSYENGHLYRQMNEGTNEKPAFTGKNIPVMAGSEPFALPAKMTAPRLVDWDGDGDMDLIAGSFGDTYGQKKGGGVYLSLNRGAPGQPDFGPLATLIGPSSKGWNEATRPDAGLYADAVDFDGDGDLDLVVGGYSMWTPKPRELTAAQQDEVKKLREAKFTLMAAQSKLMRKVSAEAQEATKGLDRTTTEWREKWSAVYAKYRDKTMAFAKDRKSIMDQLGTLVPSAQRRAFVWLYERL